MLTQGEVTSAQQLWDTCRQWLLKEEPNTEGVIDMVALKQFIVWLQDRTAE